ncbi:lipase-like PAD4 isoform X2 [Punica granatum]|nr:lipase-like PAD4 isoform X2 [Punica granatum]
MGQLGSSGTGSGDLVPLDATSNSLFPAFKVHGGGEGEEEEETVVMVHWGMLQLFISFFVSTDLQTKIDQLMQQSKSLVITGHSVGATTASLTVLWLLCRLKSTFSSPPVLCITFGSPLLGNESLTNAILRERWGGRFCHIVSNYDIMPRLLFAPLLSVTHQLHFLLQFWHLSMASQTSQCPVLALTEQDINGFFGTILSSVEVTARTEEGSGSGMKSFWPFGSYLFCSEEGAICMDNETCVVKMLHLMLLSGSPSRSIEDHLRYGNYVSKLSFQFLTRRNFMTREISESNYEASVSLALQSSGTHGQEPVSTLAKDCLITARRVGRAPNINSANLAIRLSKIVPFRAEIEWYKACCDKSDDQMGYYDSFKRRGASKRESRVNMNRIKLGSFWDDVIHMLERNELPHDFHRRAKWINASLFYRLLVEPLDIAEYYRLGLHHSKGHYLLHGRERRFEISDRWWREREGADKQETHKRSKFASLTQDSCFWARVEEAWDWLDDVRRETDHGKLEFLLQRIRNFEMYAAKLIETKEVSEDVIAKNSTYSLCIEKWRTLQSSLRQEHQDSSLALN